MGLAGVIFLAFATLKLISKWGTETRENALFKVLGRHNLGRRSSIASVSYGQKTYILGLADGMAPTVIDVLDESTTESVLNPEKHDILESDSDETNYILAK